MYDKWGHISIYLGMAHLENCPNFAMGQNLSFLLVLPKTVAQSA